MVFPCSTHAHNGPIHLPPNNDDEKGLPTHVIAEAPAKHKCRRKFRPLKFLIKFALVFFIIRGIMHLGRHIMHRHSSDLDAFMSFWEFGENEELWSTMSYDDGFDEDGDFEVDCPAWPLDNIPEHPPHRGPPHETSTSLVGMETPLQGSQSVEFLDSDASSPFQDMPSDHVNFFDSFDSSDSPHKGRHLHGHHKAPYNSTLSFVLPTTSSLNYLLSKGRTAGAVAIIANSSIPKDEIHVVVTANFWHPYALLGKKGKRRAFACQVTSEDGDHTGVVVFNKGHKHHHHSPPHREPGEPDEFTSPHRGPGHRHGRHFGVIYHILVQLPYTEGEVTSLNEFKTKLPIFPHFIGNLKDKVSFESVALKGTNAPIWVKSLTGTAVKALNVNGPIGGDFSATKSIHLGAINAPVHVNVSVSNDDEAYVLLNTVHGPLNASIAIDSPTAYIDASNKAGSIALDIPTLPEKGELHVNATNVIGSVSIALPQEYEGTFKLKTTMAPSSVEVTDTDEDSGYKKFRSGDKEGWFEWSDENGREIGEGRDRGSVEVKTLLAPIKLVW